MQRLFDVVENTLNLNEGEFFLRIFNQPDKQQLVIMLNQRSQLFEQGVNSLGRIIGTYSPATEAMSGGRKRAGSPYNFLDTGAFFESFEVIQVTPESLTINADGQKDDENLFAKFGDELLGLTDESLTKLKTLILPEIIDLTQKQILK